MHAGNACPCQMPKTFYLKQKWQNKISETFCPEKNFRVRNILKAWARKWYYVIRLKVSWLNVVAESPLLTSLHLTQLPSPQMTARNRHQCRKTTVLNCHRHLSNTGVEKNKLHLNIDLNFDHQMSLSKSKCWYWNNCLQFLKCAVSLMVTLLNRTFSPTDCIIKFWQNDIQPIDLWQNVIVSRKCKLFHSGRLRLCHEKHPSLFVLNNSIGNDIS